MENKKRKKRTLLENLISKQKKAEKVKEEKYRNIFSPFNDIFLPIHIIRFHRLFFNYFLYMLFNQGSVNNISFLAFFK